MQLPCRPDGREDPRGSCPSRLAWTQGDYDAASSRYEEGLAIQRDLGDRQGAAGSFHRLGQVAFARGDYEAARAHFA